MNQGREGDYPRGRPDLRSRIVDQILGAFVAALLIGFVGWIAGFADMKNEVTSLAKTMIKIEAAVDTTKKDVGDLKMSGFMADASLDKRVSVIEDQRHQNSPSDDQRSIRGRSR